MNPFRWLTRKPTQDAFATQMLAHLKAMNLAKKYQYDKEAFRLVDSSTENGGTFFLHNVYADYCKASKSDRQRVLEKYAQAACPPELPKEFASARQHLLPAIRSNSDFAMMDLMMRAEGQDSGHGPASMPLVEDLVISVAYDSEHSMMRIRQADITAWGVTMDQVLEAAIENLRERSMVPQFETIAPGVYVAKWSDYYDPSRLLLTDVIRQLQLKGDPVVLVPTPNHLLVTGSEHPPGLSALAQLGGDLLRTETKHLSGTALRLRDTSWEAFDAEGQQCRALADLQRLNLAMDYQQQKELLEKLYEKTAEDIFVASYQVYEQTDTKALNTHCVWTKGVIADLPHTDQIIFMDMETKQPTFVEWSVAMKVVGSRMKPLGLHPERHRVEEFPSVEELSRMQASLN